MGQILLARRMGKTRIIAETGAGQHGVATATMCALFGLPCTVYMGATDVERQKPNVFRMKLLGAEVKPVTSGAATLKDAMNEAMRDWVANVRDTYYLIGTVAGPHPYPMMVRDFQSVIGEEAKAAIAGARGAAAGCRGRLHRRRLERHGAVPPVPGRSGGAADRRRGGGARARHRTSTRRACSRGRPGVLHGNRTYLLQDDDGQIEEAHSISAGLDYPGIGPEHAWLHDIGRVEYVAATDEEALGRVPALHADRGHHPRARTGARARACGEARARDAEGRDHPDESVRPRRQGHLHGRRVSGSEIVSRIAARFAELKREGRGALIPFLEAWDPDGATSLELLRGMPGAGADLIEMGMPFTDPMADGPDDPGRRQARAQSGRDARAHARDGARLPAENEGHLSS